MTARRFRRLQPALGQPPIGTRAWQSGSRSWTAPLRARAAMDVADGTMTPADQAAGAGARVADAASSQPPRHAHATHGREAALTLSALGVVYGDIGTSPLYAFRESFLGHGHQLRVTEANIVGVLSLIFWSLVIIISIKYVVFVMRADNQGEGGILALTSLVTRVRTLTDRRRWILILIGLFGAALFYGDGMITPAISVLSAVEGTEVATEAFDGFVVPIAVAILVGLFAIQRRGTASIGRLFGPVMVVWFSTLAVLGAVQMVANPAIVRGARPPLRRRVLRPQRHQGLPGAGFGVPRGHRRRGPLRGHGALRPPPDRHRVVLLRVPCVAPELLRAGSPAARRARIH